jgi:catechol 2,3-dioxygenase-like lactoylglutathione lyase family enzyme
MTDYAVPIFPSRDLEETLAFYRRLGFRGALIAEHRYVIVNRGEFAEIHFYEAAETDPATNSHGCYLSVDDAALLHGEWSGVEGVNEPREMEWGMREFAVVDPSGNLIRVGSPL